MTVRCAQCGGLFGIDKDRAHRLRSEWDRDGTRRQILCPTCANVWPPEVAL